MTEHISKKSVPARWQCCTIRFLSSSLQCDTKHHLIPRFMKRVTRVWYNYFHTLFFLSITTSLSPTYWRKYIRIKGSKQRPLPVKVSRFHNFHKCLCIYHPLL